MTELSLTLFSITIGKNDIALYAMIGSAAYNMLIIACICCFCVYSFKITFNMSTLFKHSAFYSINLFILIGILYKNHNSRFYWYDSLVSILVYVAFSLVTVYEHNVIDFFKRLTRRNRHIESSNDEVEPDELVPSLETSAKRTSTVSTTTPQVVKPLLDKADLMLINKYKLVDLVLADSTNNFNTYQTDRYVNDSYNEPYDFMQSYKEIKPLNLSKKFKLITVLPARIFAYLMIVDFRRFQMRKNLFFPITLITSFVILIGCSFILIWFDLLYLLIKYYCHN